MRVVSTLDVRVVTPLYVATEKDRSHLETLSNDARYEDG